MPEHLENAIEKHDKQTTMPVLKDMSKAAWIVAEAMLTKPSITQKELAKLANVTRGYVSRIQNSPVFKKTLRELRTAAMMDKMAALASKSIDKADEMLDNAETSEKTKLDILKVSMTAMGMGANQGTPAKGDAPAVQVNLGVTNDMVKEALARKQKKQEAPLEAEFTEVPDEQGE